MWKKEIHHQLGLDILPLRRKGMNFTWKTLDALRSRLNRATVYECGTTSELAASLAQTGLETRPSLFDEALSIKPLPQAHMLLEWTDGEQPLAALLTDRISMVELHVFRHAKDLNRWRWPFLGMAYGPGFNDSSLVAVLEPATLAELTPNARQALVRQHSTSLGTILSALELVRVGKLLPTGEVGPTALALEGKKKHKQSLPTPSSLARASRTRHEGAMTGKGAHRA